MNRERQAQSWENRLACSCPYRCSYSCVQAGCAAGASEVPVKCVEFPANRGGPHRIRSMSCSVRVRAAPLCWAYLSYLLGSYSYRKRQGLITNWRVFLFSMCGETGKQYGLGRSQVSALSAYLGITAFEFVERVQEIGNLKTNTAGLG